MHLPYVTAFMGAFSSGKRCALTHCDGVLDETGKAERAKVIWTSSLESWHTHVKNIPFWGG
jgi:hypothetical protein